MQATKTRVTKNVVYFLFQMQIFSSRVFQNAIASFFLKGFIAVDMPFLFFVASTCKKIFDRNVQVNYLLIRIKPERNLMKEYENNSTTNNNNHDIALSIATLITNFHISFTLERNRLIENHFMSLNDYVEAMALIKFQLNLFF